MIDTNPPDPRHATKEDLKKHREWTRGAIHEILSLIVNLEARLAKVEPEGLTDSQGRKI